VWPTTCIFSETAQRAFMKRYNLFLFVGSILALFKANSAKQQIKTLRFFKDPNECKLTFHGLSRP